MFGSFVTTPPGVFTEQEVTEGTSLRVGKLHNERAPST